MGVLKSVEISKELAQEMIETAHKLEEISNKLTLELGLLYSHREFMRLQWVQNFLDRIANEFG